MRSNKKAKTGPGRWCLYILKCNDGTLYTGISNDLQRRIGQHNNGTASRYTRSRLPVKLIYQERCRGRSSALKKEYAIKQLSKLEKERYINEAKPQTNKRPTPWNREGAKDAKKRFRILNS